MNLMERLKGFARAGSAPINDACAQAFDEIEKLQAAPNMAEPTLDEIRDAFDGDSIPRKNIALRKAYDEITRQRGRMVTHTMVQRALAAWFNGPQSESDMGLERGMRAAIEAALDPDKILNPEICSMCGEPRDGRDHSPCDRLPF